MMGADYMIYTEVKRNNKWHAVNGMYYSDSEKQYVLAETYWNGSRTYFSRTYDKLNELGRVIRPRDLSEEVLKKEDWLKEEDDDMPIISVDWKTLLSAIPKTDRKELCGYVHKRVLWEYENEDAEIDDYLSGEEYNALSDAEKKEYEFYEWDDPLSWYSYLRVIKEKARHEIHSYMSVNGLWDEPEDFRIVCIVSW